MSQKIIILLLFISIVIIGILFALPGMPENKPIENTAASAVNTDIGIECEQDSDCLAGGCSGQFCLPRNKADSVVSTCEWRDEYACYGEDDCICRNNKCQWTGNEAFSECIEAFR